MNNSEILPYQATDGKIKIDVRLEDETVWLTQDHTAGLFGKSKKTISEHIRNIFSEGELDEQVVVRKFPTTTQHGAMPDKTQSRDVQFYNLDVIISVGYRGQVPSGHPVPYLGHPAAEGIYRQGVCPERRALQNGQLDGLFHGAAGAHS